MSSFVPDIRFAPLLLINWLLLLGAFTALFLTFAFIKIRTRAIWRALFFTALFGVIANPKIAIIKAKPQKDVAAIIIDNSSSMRASKRIEGARLAAAKIEQALKEYPNLEIRNLTIGDSADGTILSKTIEEVFGGTKEGRIAGAVYIGDGNIAQNDKVSTNFPIHQIIIGEENEIDRRLEILKAPVSAPVGTIAKYRLRVIQTGNAQTEVVVKVYFGNNEVREISAKVNQEFEIEIPIETRGKTPIAFEASAAIGEISKANNSQTLNIIGIAENLRVLLVTGEPYEGARAWRNLLKSDPSIDLVHFTILRGPEDSDDDFNSELSLIPFPTDELFFEHLDNFDLIVFDRFKRLDALPDYYIARVAAWIEKGGGFLLLAGPDELENNGIMATPLARLMPITGTASANDSEFKPSLTEIGAKHPITRDFSEAQKSWGNWPNAIKYEASGETLLSANGAPLLVVKQALNGRVGIILSDKAWVWQRGYQGGGPFRSLMARIIYWLLKDPELENELLSFTKQADNLILKYNGTQTSQTTANIFAPNGDFKVNLETIETSQMVGNIIATDYGLYRAQLGTLAANIIFGEKGETDQDLVATAKKILSVSENFGAKSVFIGRDGKGKMPNFAPQSPLNFANPSVFGLRQNSFKSKESIVLVPILPPVAYSFLLALLALLTWFNEGGASVHSNKFRLSPSKANAQD